MRRMMDTMMRKVTGGIMRETAGLSTLRGRLTKFLKEKVKVGALNATTVTGTVTSGVTVLTDSTPKEEVKEEAKQERRELKAGTKGTPPEPHRGPKEGTPTVKDTTQRTLPTRPAISRGPKTTGVKRAQKVDLFPFLKGTATSVKAKAISPKIALKAPMR